MARTFSAKKSKAGKEIKCGRCSTVIQPGEQYFYFSVGFRGSKQYRCHLHHPLQSELCGSKMSGAYAANEQLESAIGTAESLEDLASILESTAEEIEGVRDEYQDSYDNLPDNFRDGDMGSEMQEKIDGLDSYASTLNDKASEIRGLEPDEDTDDHSPVAEGEAVEPEPKEDLMDAARDLAEEALGEFSL